MASRSPPSRGDALDGSRLREDDRRRARRPPPPAERVSASERGVLTNARCLTEGVDVPTLDGVAFIDPRRSQVDVVQAVGRAIRKAEDKALGTIVIPVLVTRHDDPEEVAGVERVRPRLGGRSRAENHDDDLADELDALRREQGRRGSVKGRPDKIVLDLPVGISSSFADAFDAIVVKRATTYGEEGLGAAMAFRREHGHLRVRANHVTETGFKLGSWIVVRRVEYREGRLSQERIAQLDALDMIWDPLEADWRSAVAAATAYRPHMDTCVSPEATSRMTAFSLGSWISYDPFKARIRCRQSGPRSSMRSAWSGSPSAKTGRRTLAAAKSFRESHGHLLVPPRFKAEDGLHLGGWITHQRARRANGSLSPEQIAALDDLGMVWDPGAARWETKLAAARRFSAEHGHLRVPDGFVDEDGVKLGVWVQTVRNRQDLLSRERRQQLDTLGMVWNPAQAVGIAKIAAAREYRAAHGHLRVPPTFVTDDGIKLGVWIQACDRSERVSAGCNRRSSMNSEWSGTRMRPTGRGAGSRPQVPRTARRPGRSAWLRK